MNHMNTLLQDIVKIFAETYAACLNRKHARLGETISCQHDRTQRDVCQPSGQRERTPRPRPTAYRSTPRPTSRHVKHTQPIEKFMATTLRQKSSLSRKP